MTAKTVAIEIKIAGNFMLKFDNPKIEMLKFWRSLNGKLMISPEKMLAKFMFAEDLALSISADVRPFGAIKIV